jgi:hypothetical protein
VVEYTARSADNQVDTLYELFGLCLAVRASHDDGVSLIVMLAEFLCDAKDLECKLPSRRKNKGSGALTEDVSIGMRQRIRATHRSEA